MRMFARVSFLASLGFASILGCSASVGTFEGSGGSPSGTGGAGVPGAGGADGAGGAAALPSGGAVGAGGTVVGAGGAVVGAGGAVVGAGGADVGAGGAVVGAGGAADAGPGCSATAFTVSNMSYIDNGKFCGYAWTAAYAKGGATIEPPCPAAGGDCFTGTICATADIPANDATENVYPGVMIGWNVAQKSSGGAVGNFTGDFSSITPTFTTSGVTGEVRLVVQSGNTDYCATAKSGTAIPRSGFAENCWDAAGSTPLPAGTPIKAILLQVNGSDAAQPNAEFCLTDLKVQ